MESEAIVKARAAHESAQVMALAETGLKNNVLAYIADELERHAADIIEANHKDIGAARNIGMSDAMLDRLRLTKERIFDMAEGVRQVIKLPDPAGKCLAEWDRPNGLHIRKVTVPLGVVAMVYESRPNVTVDAAALCIKSGNACVLRGGSEAVHSNMALVAVVKRGLEAMGLPPDAVGLLENTDRRLVKELLTLRQYVDLAIPRGGAGLIRMVVETATVPCIETGSGVCHVYIDKDADLDKAVRIAENAKVSRPSTCNAMETLLVHQAVAEPFMSRFIPLMKQDQVELRGDETICRMDEAIHAADDEDWRTEYNALVLSVRIVGSAAEAVDHIRKYSTHHSEAIVTENVETARKFARSIDSAAVYINASTRFTDGFEYGFGAEIGISTQKLHVRGPMGLDALVSYKYVVCGSGQIR